MMMAVPKDPQTMRRHRRKAQWPLNKETVKGKARPQPESIFKPINHQSGGSICWQK
uniref:Uncharacterized protein n=1 Tax=Rhizophora mucronata TaxID=61149 RepID=A0A2P2NDP3_RHIMU